MSELIEAMDSATAFLWGMAVGIFVTILFSGRRR